MPEEIVTRVLCLPGYGIYAAEADEAANTLTLWIRQTAGEPYYVCGGCGISVREIHSWTERRIRDLPWGSGFDFHTFQLVGATLVVNRSLGSMRPELSRSHALHQNVYERL